MIFPAMEAGHHMRACCGETPGALKIKRDSMGNVTSMEGISAEMLKWIALAFNITYECENVPITTIENTSTAVGALHYVTHDICDVLIGPSAFRYDRFQVMDFLHPWVTEPIQLLIPMPAFVSNPLAFIEPFTFQVWMILLCSILVVISMLVLMDYFKGPLGSHTIDTKHAKLNLYWLFVIGSLFGRAAFWVSNKSRIRILIAAWLLAAFVLLQLYTIQLFGFVLTNVPLPIVSSTEELANKPNIDLVVAIGWAPDLAITKSDFPLMKKLAKKLNENPTSRCLSVSLCIELMKKNKRPAVFIHQIGPMSLGMMNDFHQTGKCNFALARKRFDNVHQSWMIRKRDPSSEFYNRAIMRMHETGLLNHWLDTYQPKPYKCLEMAKPQDNSRKPAKISIMNLSMSFGALIVGYILSLVVLIWEKGHKRLIGL